MSLPEAPPIAPPDAHGGEKWETPFSGVRRKVWPFTPGPWFQYRDAVGFEWNTYEVILPDLPEALDGFRLIHLSDLHCQTHWQTAYDDLIDRLNLQEPDLIVISGDIVDDTEHPWVCLPVACRFLSLLRAPHGVLGIRGNHDANLDPGELNETPLRMIEGQRLLIPHGGANLEVIGTHGPQRRDYVDGFESTLPEKEPGVPRIIVSHYPDHIRRMESLKSDIFLAGHTHGGQICLPGGIPVIRHDSLPMRYWRGVHRLLDSLLFVNRGLGFSTQPFRIFCPAEVIEIRLRKSAECKMQSAE